VKDFFLVDPSPESDEVSLATADGVQITRFTEYEFSSDFLTPADGFSFTYEPGDTSKDVVQKIPSEPVREKVRAAIQAKLGADVP
jgi:hypothetical protein